MRIVFGWNSFAIKSFAPAELGFPETPGATYRIQARQKYVHLFWIPFFGTGKKWVLKKEGKLYELPIEYEAHLSNSRVGGVRTPWYTFSGPLLILLCGFIYWASEQYDGYKSDLYARNEFSRKATEAEAALRQLSTNDFVKIRDHQNPYDSRGMYLKAERIDPSGVLFTKVFVGKDDYEMSPLDVEHYYTAYKKNLDTVFLSHADLTAALAKDYDAWRSNGWKGAALLDDGRRLEIERIEPHFKPVIGDHGTGGMGSGGLSIGLENKGWPAAFVSIKNLGDTAAWDSSLPANLEEASPYAYKNFVLSTDHYTYNQPYKLLLVVEDSLHRQFKYTVEGRNFDKTVQEIR